MNRIYPPMPDNPLPEFYEMNEPLEMDEEWLQTECTCKPDSVEVCLSCKQRVQTKFGSAIPFEGAGI